MKSSYWSIGVFAVIGSLTGTALSVLLRADSPPLWAAVGTALGAGIGLGVASVLQSRTTESACVASERSRTENSDRTCV